MSPREHPVVFDCEGDRLIGIATVPDKPSRLGVLIVVGGPQYRVGSHRQFVHLARSLAREGYPTFRFDYRGMGDSEGAMRSFEQVEPDIHAAVRAFRSVCPDVQRLVVFGLCDAASAVLMAAERIDSLAGMILANPWVRRAETLNAAVVRHYYRRRFFSTEFWRKVFSGNLEIRSVAAEFLERVSNFVCGRSQDSDSAGGDFIDRMRHGWHLPVSRLLLLSGKDITAREFDDVRVEDKRWDLGKNDRLLVEARFGDADHTFSVAQWRDELSAQCCKYVANSLESAYDFNDELR